MAALHQGSPLCRRPILLFAGSIGKIICCRCSSNIVDDKDCKAIYEGLVSGDPKMRTLRALYQRVYGKYAAEAKKKEGT